MRWLSLLFFVVLLPGCMICPDGGLKVVDGSTPVVPGATIQFAFYWDGDAYSTPDECGGFWYVNGVQGGTVEAGTITSCGRYRAPSTLPSQPPVISATKYPVGCADCCPFAYMTLGYANGI